MSRYYGRQYVLPQSDLTMAEVLIENIGSKGKQMDEPDSNGGRS
jgi:hypothetical protein